MANSGLFIRPATADDVLEATELTALARADNPFDWACYPEVYSTSGICISQDELGKLTQSRKQFLYDALKQPETKVYVTVRGRA